MVESLRIMLDHEMDATHVGTDIKFLSLKRINSFKIRRKPEAVLSSMLRIPIRR
jgi:hypothetical protein